MGKKEQLGVFVVLLFLGFCAVVGAWQVFPPASRDGDISAGKFSASRALEHLEAIAAAPRVPGQPYHREARDYITATLQELGVETEVQRETVITPDRRQVPFTAGLVHNIIGRIPGQNSQGAVLLMAHYDSVPTGPGVGDDALAVAAMLEAARALQAGEPLQNDIILLFTDGHEYGLLGARAFVQGHHLAQEVEVVFNFEGQGPQGPVYMFETSNLSSWLMEGLQQGVTRPLASSLSEDVYHLLNFDNDFRIFADHNYPGLGMAVLSDMAYYHSERDNLERLDKDSLQHQGEYVLGLSQFSGNSNLPPPAGEELVFFNLTGNQLVFYRQLWALPLSLLAVLLLGLIWYWQRPPLTGAASGLLVLLLSLGLTAGIIGLISEYFDFGVNTYRSSYLQGGLASLALALTLGLFYFAARFYTPWDLGWGVMLVWAFLAVSSSLFLPGASYIFFLPLVLGRSSLLIPSKAAIFFPLSVVMAGAQVFLLVPLIIVLYRALTMEIPYPGTLLVVLLGSLLVPILKGAFNQLRWWLPGTLALMGLIFFLSGLAPYDSDHPGRNTLIYYLEEDETARWVSLTGELDEWNKNFLGAEPTRDSLQGLTPFFPVEYLQAAAPVIEQEKPGVELMEDRISGGERTLRLRVFSPREAEVIKIYLDQGTEIISSAVAGQRVTGRFEGDWYWGLRFWGLPPAGIELELVVPAQQEVGMLVVDQSFGLRSLQEAGWQSRPGDLMAHPDYYRETDSIMAVSTHSF